MALQSLHFTVSMVAKRFYFDAFHLRTANCLYVCAINFELKKTMEKCDLKVIAENSIDENVLDEATDEVVETDEEETKANAAIDLIPSIGRISLQFYDGICPPDCNYPKTYYTVNGKERLILIFAENFRRQYVELNPKRNSLVLAVQNECEIQKFVSTTIRPSVFLFAELIDGWQGPAQFVADFIRYEPLEDQTHMVSTYKIPIGAICTEQKIKRFFFVLLFRECFIKFTFLCFFLYM